MSGRKSAVLAAIDVGTNSFHLVIAKVSPTGGIEVMTREREMVRLGKGGGDMRRLDDDAVERGIAALRRMKLLADGAGAPLRAIATSAVREAENADMFVARARAEAGVDVEIVSGVEEARLIHVGVLQALPVFDKRLMLCDIGGGSTELLFGHRGEVLDARSLKLGAVRLTDRFFGTGKVKGGELKACRAHIRSTLAPFQKVAEHLPFDVAIGSSGTAETVARLAHARRGGSAARTYNGFEVTAAEVRDICALLAATKPEDRVHLAGMDPKRADIALAGAVILDEVVSGFGIKSLIISDFALREGILLDTLARMDDGQIHHLGDLSRRSVRRLLETCDTEPAHAEHVARLATQLFDETQLLHGLPDDCRDYLEAAALLANVGLFVSHSRHHQHSYYLIRNSDALAGLTDAEIEIIALVARYHRKGLPKNDHPEFARMRPDQQHIVRVLAGIVRIAIGLDRRHDGRVTGVTARRQNGGLTLAVQAPAGADLSLEIYAAEERLGLLADVLATSLTVIAAS
jgi:exopolyphosphatase / guanosine-5'-triphosphate,3'-diphosphate pyrophosphatase